MYYFDGQDVKTVARKLEISTSGVYQKLRAAIKELHDRLTTQGERS
jgi:DNA-directed RNA polymerase specialized sigma subunit